MHVPDEKVELGFVTKKDQEVFAILVGPKYVWQEHGCCTKIL